MLVTVVFSSLWPTSARARAAGTARRALDQLASFVRDGLPMQAGPRLAVLESIEEARRLAGFAPFELRMTPASPGERLSAEELDRVAGVVFVAGELHDPAAVTPLLEAAPPADRVAAHARALLFAQDKETHAAAT